MKSVSIVKTRSTEVGSKETREHISLSVAKAGILTQVHNLLQVAGLTYEMTFGHDMEHYEKGILEKREGNLLYIRYDA